MRKTNKTDAEVPVGSMSASPSIDRFVSRSIVRPYVLSIVRPSVCPSVRPSVRSLADNVSFCQHHDAFEIFIISPHFPFHNISHFVYHILSCLGRRKMKENDTTTCGSERSTTKTTTTTTTTTTTINNNNNKTTDKT